MKTSFLAALVFFTAFTALGAPPSADEVLVEARTKASLEHKAIFVHFGASWCGWCRRLDAWLETREMKPVFEKYFVPVKLVVQENEKNKALENRGADAVLKRLGGPAGLPYLAFLDKDGKLVVNSMRPSSSGAGENIGYPAQPQEVDWFVSMMKKAAPGMAEEDLKVLEASLRAPKK
jgi:thiol-disulfide isomerase/thioredoxin